MTDSFLELVWWFSFNDFLNNERSYWTDHPAMQLYNTEGAD